MNEAVTVIGGINIDIKGYPLQHLVAETSNPGRIYTSPGGVARNIAHNLALLDVPVYLLGAVGDDGFGAHVLEKTQEAGVQVENVRVMTSLHSGMYLSLLDQTRQLVVAISDMDILHCVDTDYIHAHQTLIEQSRFVVMDTNLDVEVLRDIIGICRHHHIPFLIEPVSMKKTEKIRDISGHLDFMTPNLAELGVLANTTITHPQGAARLAASLGEKYRHVLVTAGEHGLLSYRHGDAEGTWYPPLPTRVVDANGAGDAFVAGFVCGMTHQFSVEHSIRLGIAASHVTLESEETVTHDLSFQTCLEFLA